MIKRETEKLHYVDFKTQYGTLVCELKFWTDVCFRLPYKKGPLYGPDL